MVKVRVLVASSYLYAPLVPETYVTLKSVLEVSPSNFPSLIPVPLRSSPTPLISLSGTTLPMLPLEPLLLPPLFLLVPLSFVVSPFLFVCVISLPFSSVGFGSSIDINPQLVMLSITNASVRMIANSFFAFIVLSSNNLKRCAGCILN